MMCCGTCLYGKNTGYNACESCIGSNYCEYDTTCGHSSKYDTTKRRVVMEKQLDKEKLYNIREFIKNEICRNYDIMHNEEMRKAHIPEIIVGLYEYLNYEVTGEHYECMSHWANKIGSWVDTYDFDNYLERGEWDE